MRPIIKKVLRSRPRPPFSDYRLTQSRCKNKGIHTVAEENQIMESNNVLSTGNVVTSNTELSADLSSSEASAAEIISRMSEYQFIAVVQDGTNCGESIEQVVNERGEMVVSAMPSNTNTDEYYETIGEEVVELNFDGINTMQNSDDNSLVVGSGSVVEENNHHSEISSTAASLLQQQHQQEQHVVQETLHEMQTQGVLTAEQINSAPTETIENYETEGCENLSVRDILLPLGIKISDKDETPSTKKKRSRCSLFLGGGNESAYVLQDFESLKMELKMKSNLDLLKFLIQNLRKDLGKPFLSSENLNDQNNTKAILDLINHEEKTNKKNGNNSKAVSTKREPTFSQGSGATFPTPLIPVTDVRQILGLTALDIKTIQLARKYLEFITKEGFYLAGFVDGSERLDEFLKSFRIMTGSAFSIRRSKAKLNDDPDPEEKPLRKYKPGYLGKGQIKWEKNIGIPPIPFTGVPFTTEGTTTYQCVYGPKRTKVSVEQKEPSDEENSLNEPTPKKRRASRESKKKDCPAQIHIRTVHRFPTYNCLSPVPPVKSTSTTNYVNKCQRGIILAKLREDIINNKVQGQQGFWIRVPLPDVHQNHSLGPFDVVQSALTEETILEMKSILHNAAIS